MAEEDLHHLRQADDLREQRDLFPPERVGIPAAVPMLVHRENRGGHSFGEADHPRDLRAALAAVREDPLAAAARPEQREPAKAPELRDQPAAAADVLPGVRDLSREAPPVAQPGGALHFLIVAAEQFVHDGRVGGAAGVFEQRGVHGVPARGDPRSDRACESPARTGETRRLADDDFIIIESAGFEPGVRT